MDAVAFVLRHLRAMAIGGFVAGVLAIALVALTRRYVAESRFSPQTGNASPSQLAGLAAQFGVNLGMLGEGESIDFYAQLLRSRELLSQVAQARYRVDVGDTTTRTFLDIAGVSASTPERRLLRGVKRLENDVAVSRDLKANIVTLRTVGRSPVLAEGLNRQMLERVNSFNINRRQTRAASERKFVEARLEQAGGELAAAESGLEAFLQRNRSYQNAPQLVFEHDRLERRVELRQKIYSTLLEAYEKARIDEVRNTPVLTIIDTPEGSSLPTRSLAKSGILGAIVGVVLTALVSLLLDYLRSEAVAGSASDRTTAERVRRILRFGRRS
jgi:uncharacterized protein involved in exopolysaccharide biosynthesis